MFLYFIVYMCSYVLAIPLSGCISLTNPPPEVVRRGTEYIIGFLRRSLAGTVQCRRTKLMMVGLGGAGKTKYSRI